MSRLRIAPGFALPVDVAGEAIAILAKRGAGKTNTGRVLVEELHGAGVQFVVLDPVSAWWGLRSSADGKSGGLTVPVFGGAHGDVPLQATAGALLADVVVDTGQSVVLDLSDFSKTEQRRFVTDFAERLYQRKARDRALLHVVLEEADEFAPQRVNAGDARMVGAIEQLVRRGRGRGIGLTFITQRSASLNKSVLTQADVLIVLRTTGPQDRKAIEAWVEKQDVDGADDVVPALPGLETGEAFVWNPERCLLERVKIRLAHTFDSSSTPKAGQARTEPRELAAIDLTKLGAEIEATAERAKDNDPAELRKKIHSLERELDAQKIATDMLARRRDDLERALEERPAEAERVEVPALDERQVSVLEGAIDQAYRIGEQVAALERTLQPIRDRLETLITKEEACSSTPVSDSSQTSTRSGDGGAGSEAAASSAEVRSTQARAGAAPAKTTPTGAEGRVSGPQQRILNALAALEAIGISDAHKTQLALFAEASPKSSAYANNLGALRTAGLVEYPSGGRVCLTPDGRVIADGSHAPTRSHELHGFVYGLVGGAKSRLLEQLIASYPATLSKDELATLAGASATSSAFANNLGSLRSLGLIDYPRPGEVVALPILFLES